MARAEAREDREAPPPKLTVTIEPVDPVITREGGEPLEEWDGGIAKRTLSFYHAEGAPYLDDNGKLHATPPAEELEELQRQGLAIRPTILEEIVKEVVQIRDDVVAEVVYPAKVPRASWKRERNAPEPGRPVVSVEKGVPLVLTAQKSRAAAVSVQKPRAAPTPPEAEPEAAPVRSVEKPQAPPAPHMAGAKRPGDMSGLEELLFMALKTVFPGGLKIPLKKEGLIDVEVTIDGKEIMVDFKGPLADVPALAVWRFTFAYEGEPLAIWGRGVKGDIKIFRYRLVRFMIRAWFAKRKRKKAALLAARDGWGVLERNKHPQKP